MENFRCSLKKGGYLMHRMYADFSDKLYKDMINGEAKSNNDFRKNDGSYQLIEVKCDNKIDDEAVLAKKRQQRKWQLQVVSTI